MRSSRSTITAQANRIAFRRASKASSWYTVRSASNPSGVHASSAAARGVKYRPLRSDTTSMRPPWRRPASARPGAGGTRRPDPSMVDADAVRGTHGRARGRIGRELFEVDTVGQHLIGNFRDIPMVDGRGLAIPGNRQQPVEFPQRSPVQGFQPATHEDVEIELQDSG